jgi:redox-sensing transcriptional repressor
MKKERVSPYVIKRLPRYYRFLGDLIEEGTLKISSGALAERMKLTASQIRQDLNCFGEFGQQGYGYNVEALRNEIGKIIGVGKLNSAIVVGAGSVGRAICEDVEFEKRGCKLIGVFDDTPALKGELMGGHKVREMNELAGFCKKNSPQIAVLCVPRESAKAVCEKLIGLKVTNFWNFTHYDINLHFDDVNVETAHVGDSLLALSYKLNRCRDKRAV